MQNSLRVLLLEDDETDAELVCSLLSDTNGTTFKLERVSNSVEAIDRLRQHQYDVCLVGCLSADLEWMRSIADREVPVILLVELNDRDCNKAIEAGADHLVKPLTSPLLQRTVRNVVERSRSLKHLQQALQENNWLSAAIDHMPLGVVMTDSTAPDNPIVSVNSAFTRMTGYTAEEVQGRNCRFLQGPGTDPIVTGELREALSKFSAGVTPASQTFVLLNYRKNGTPFWNEVTLSPVYDSEGKLKSYVGLQNDVTVHKQMEAARRESEERYALVVQAARDGIWDWNLKTSEVYFSSRWKAMLGYDEDEIGSRLEEWLDRIHPDDLNWVEVKLRAYLDQLTPSFENEHRVRHRDGSYRWVLNRGLAVVDASGQVIRVAGSQTDITAHKQAEAQLLHDTLHDELTRLPNRTLLVDRLFQAILLSKRSASFLFAVLFLDFDRFKVINDSLGHRIGDQLLVSIAQRLTACLRPGDTVARLGGDEFVILLEDVKDIGRVTTIADRIQQEITQPFNLEGREVFTTVSIGIALSPTGYDLPEDVLRDADIAMYRAKDQGRACYKVFNPSMYARAVALLQLETDLRRAIDRQEFELYYQPIVLLKSNRIVGFEALVRWQHPSRGMVAPAEFIHLAEDTGLIIPLGRWVLQEACRQMQFWHTEFAPAILPTISVNLSGKQFTPQLIEQVTQILQDTGFPAHYLRIEITESVLMENTDSASSMLTELRALGIQLSMDDFGTGYSSLSYLHRFPIDVLKIDRSFINKIDVDGEQLAIVRTIITLAWNLGMEVVAEGVETAKQLAQLRALQCECGQGYFFSKPLDRESATQLLSTDSPWILPHQRSIGAAQKRLL